MAGMASLASAVSFRCARQGWRLQGGALLQGLQAASAAAAQSSRSAAPPLAVANPLPPLVVPAGDTQRRWSSSTPSPSEGPGSDAVLNMMDMAASFIEEEVAREGPSEGPMLLYRGGLRSGQYRPDDRQERTMEMLQTLYESLRAEYPRSKRKSGLTVVDAAVPEAAPRSWWAGLLDSSEPSSSGGEVATPLAIKGLYMFGGVGCGKTMMMDLLAECAPKEFKPTRTHFHDFMLDVHSQLRKVEKSQDPLVQVASAIAANTTLLCLDEFFVTDVADAMILSRLFRCLWDRKVVLVATSNRHPDDLYKNGLQRVLFLPFIEELKQQCVVHDLASPVDYRRLAKNQLGTYFVGPSASKDLHTRVDELALGEPPKEVRLEVQMGRELKIPVVRGCLAVFTFQELCDQAIGAADYIALCTAYHTIVVDGLPIIDSANKTSAYRFVTFIDVAYEHRCRLFVSAAGIPFDVFKNVYAHAEGKQALADHELSEDEIVIDDNLGFTKDRTVSRLIEMQSDEYLEQHAEQRAPQLLMALHEKRKGP